MCRRMVNQSLSLFVNLNRVRRVHIECTKRKICQTSREDPFALSASRRNINGSLNGEIVQGHTKDSSALVAPPDHATDQMFGSRRRPSTL